MFVRFVSSTPGFPSVSKLSENDVKASLVHLHSPLSAGPDNGEFRKVPDSVGDGIQCCCTVKPPSLVNPSTSCLVSNVNVSAGSVDRSQLTGKTQCQNMLILRKALCLVGYTFQLADDLTQSIKPTLVKEQRRVPVCSKMSMPTFRAPRGHSSEATIQACRNHCKFHTQLHGQDRLTLICNTKFGLLCTSVQ